MTETQTTVEVAEARSWVPGRQRAINIAGSPWSAWSSSDDREFIQSPSEFITIFPSDQPGALYAWSRSGTRWCTDHQLINFSHGDLFTRHGSRLVDHRVRRP
jgi:hypothetical protein